MTQSDVQPGSGAAEKRAGGTLRQRLLAHLQTRLQPDPPPLRLVFADGTDFSFVEQPRVTITFRTARVLRPLLTGNFSSLGDAYVRGDLVVDGEPEEIVGVGVALAERVGRMPWLQRLGALARHLPRIRTKASDAANIEYHYDVSNEFYRLWLDRNMVYSCGYFASPSDDIHTAQERKLEHICRKLALREGERLLDIGCGWGGLLVWAAKHHGIHGVGITLSRRQYDHARDWVAREGLADRIEIRLQDYRDVPETEGFDKLVSVGMVEHVGLANLPAYFAAIHRLLKPGGILLNHGITLTDPAGRPQGPAGGDFIDRYVFPGGELPHISRLLRVMAEAGLEFGGVEDLRPHYALTLIQWSRRLEAHRDEAIALVGAEKYRIWRVYMPGMALAFDRAYLAIDQVIAYKPLAGRPSPRRLTLAHIYGAPIGDSVPGLDWSGSSGYAPNG